MGTLPGANVSSSTIYESNDKTIVVLDIPWSLEESQRLDAGQDVLRRRLYSAEPVAVPFTTPEPRDGGGAHLAQSQAAQLADLMTTATVQAALDHLSAQYAGPYCHPRLVPEDSLAVPDGYYEPQGSTHLHGSIQDMRQTFLDTAPDFQLIVLDPPWPNRSVRRSKKYRTASKTSDIKELLSLIPVPAKLAPDGLVAIWVTNAASVRDLVTSSTGLLASWGMELVTEWTWVKVTSLGEPLYDVNSRWRKPWEKLLIAKRAGARLPKVPTSKVIIAVPDLHSRKPNLRELFKDVLGDGYTGLEVFARNVTAGWWCWGDETLMFQEKRHWAVID
ncbi:hypothetical protein S40285_01505 [Stachybotrys chlorohalonatus IBT 40285]|uniref:MT-A70 family n=1 Tax=Stachybotrys chlorohalonatus (strain IBT 40285) TaxID=1283841 RepID=A0A084QMI2_STAC4|nr:hypothetical protein S40285_01505 [Stachybotrys chlorohalonata IBT 40285]